MRKCFHQLILFSLLLITGSIHAQPGEVKRYVVLTVELKNSKSFEGVKRTCWIIAGENINDTSNHFSPLLVADYYQADIDSCCRGVATDPYKNTGIDSKLDTGRSRALDALNSLIWPHRKLIQSIKTKSNGAKTRINIYATPVFGSFCACKLGFTGVKRSGYTGEVLIPYIDISYNDEFWGSDKAWSLRHIDFANNYFDFNILYNVLR